MSFKFCPMCGEKLTNESFKFCPECGYKFEADDEPAENNLQESVNEQNIKNPQDENEGLDDGLAKDKRLKLRQLELMKKYGKLTPEKEQEIEQQEKRRKEIEEKNREENERKRQEEYYNTLYAEQSQEEKEELKKWIAENKKRVENKRKKQPFGTIPPVEKAKKEEEKIEFNEAVGRKKEENSEDYGSFSCNCSEQRYNPLIGVYPEFFDGICTITRHTLIIKGKKKQKNIRFSDITSIDYKKKLIGASGIVLTLSGGNIIELKHAPQEAYNIINQIWSQGNY